MVNLCELYLVPSVLTFVVQPHRRKSQRARLKNNFETAPLFTKRQSSTGDAVPLGQKRPHVTLRAGNHAFTS
jgi:hypothetical protein